MVLFQAPPLPRYYVDRPEYSDNLKANLLTNSSDTRAIVVTAIHGLGAVGKSTLATALAYDREIQSRFSDGILWVTLGQEPNILPMLSGWVQALGDYNFKPTSVEATANHLRTLLYDKAVLLVVDDAWNTDHAKIFNFGGLRCQVLVTTREKAIADVLGAETYSLDVMTLSQSMQLLSQRLGREITGEEATQAENLVKKLGYLPLALELAAAQVEDGISWQVLLADIKRESRFKAKDGSISWRVLLTDILQDMGLKIFERPGATDVTEEASLKQLSLTALLNSSIKRLTPKTRENFIWLGILPDNVTITQGMATVLWDMDDEGNARDELEYLRSQGFLLDGVPFADGKPTYRLHNSFHELARNLLTAPLKPRRRSGISGLGIGMAEAHGIFLEKYSRLTDNHLWHTLPNDGYIHQHLVWHLEKAGKIEEVHGLLAEESKSGCNGWYETCEHLGKTGIFINDVTRGWELAEVDSNEGKLSQVVSLQCRYALITASINSLAAELPVDLLVPLMHSPEEALAYALEKPDLRDKVYYLAKLVDYLPENLKNQALSEALAAARKIRKERDRTPALIVLADKLTPEILPEAMATALKLRHTGEEYRTQVLVAFADKLIPQLLPETLNAALEISNSTNRIQLIDALTERLTPELLPEVLATVRQIRNEHHRARGIAPLAERLPEILPELLAIATQIESEQRRSEALAELSDKLTPELLPELLAAARQIQSDMYRAKTFAALSDKLTPELLSELLAAARQIQSDIHRAKALGALANRLPEILAEALAAARQIQDELSRAQALGALADKFPEILPEALAAARQIQFDKYRGNHGDQYRIGLLNALAKKLTPEVLPEALAFAREINSARYRAEAMRYLAKKLTPEVLPEALAFAREIQDNRFHFLALYNILLYVLPNKLTPEVLPEALAAAQQIQDEGLRAHALGYSLGDKLTPEILPEALDIARQIQSEEDRGRVLSYLAGKLPEILPEALDIARHIQDGYKRAQVIKTLADKLTPELLPEALDIARQIQSEEYRGEALQALVDKLTPELLLEALAAAQQIQNEEYRGRYLRALTKKLTPEMLPEALATVRQIQSKKYRGSVLKALSKKLTQIPKTQLYPLWQNNLYALSLQTCPNLISDIKALTPAILFLGGEEATNNTAIAIQDVSRWWGFRLPKETVSNSFITLLPIGE
ncbi:MAG: NB-ARC domain-containing protein [Cyanobacteriota bacterium]|nr:NB-ARC domain-containing protein [Cyanobacteriota bacterium]